MSHEKASTEVLADLAIKSLMPRMAQLIMSGQAYKTVRRLFAEADAYAAEADQKINALQAETNQKIDALQAEGRKRYKAAQEAMAALLSEQGLHAVVDDLKEARAEAKVEG